MQCSANSAHQRPSVGIGRSCSKSPKEHGIKRLMASQIALITGVLGRHQSFDAELFWEFATGSPNYHTWSLVDRVGFSEHAYMHHVRVITSKKMACTSFIMTYIHATVAGKVLGAIEGCVCPLKQRSMLVNVGVNASQCSKKSVLCCFCMQKIRLIFFPYMELGVSIMSMGYIEHPKALI